MSADDAALTAQQIAEEAQAQADFDSGGIPDDTAARTEPPAPAEATPAAPAPPATPAPKYVRVTEEQFNALNAAAAKTATFEGQLSKAFGTIGNMQKVLTGLQSGTPRGGKIEIPKDALADMERDFPELAQQFRGALEKTLAGFTGTGPANAEIDPDTMKRLVSEHAAKARIDAEIEALEDEYPTWRKIVGHVDISKDKPDPNNPFRKWLATKSPEYQARLNGTNSAAVLARGIRAFQSETKPAAAAPSSTARDRAARIAGAVQPRGDGGRPEPANTAEDEFAAGFTGT